MKYLKGGSKGVPEQRQQPSSEQGDGRLELDWAVADELTGERSTDLALAIFVLQSDERRQAVLATWLG